MSNPQKHYLTAQQHQDFKEKLAHLNNVLIPANSIALDKAKAQGDLSENAEYDAARDEQGKLHAEKNRLQHILNNAAIIQKNTSNDFIDIGHFIEIEWQHDQFQETIQLLGYGNGDDTIPLDSPLGKSLLGKKVNDSVTYDSPSGLRTYKILSINIE